MRRAAGAICLALGLALAGAHPVFAQRDPDQMSRQELLQRIQREFEDRIAVELELTDEQRAALPEILAEFGAARRELGEMREAFMDRVGTLLAANEADPLQALTLIEEGRALRAREEQLLVQEEERLLAVLEPDQVLVLQTLRDQFGDLIQSVRSRGQVDQLSRNGAVTPPSPDNPRR
jgi:Spy/CpxP family protein refolding chaperone